jgi:hypothetical protein
LILGLEPLFGGREEEIASTAADLFKGSKVQLASLDSALTFQVKLVSYRATLETYGMREYKFAPNSQLYREIQKRKFTQKDITCFHDRQTDKGWEDSADGILEGLDHHQSILEAVQQTTTIPVQFQKEQIITARLYDNTRT